MVRYTSLVFFIGMAWVQSADSLVLDESFYDNLSLVEANTASTENLSSISINLYPNPTKDIVHVGGVDTVDTIRHIQ